MFRSCTPSGIDSSSHAASSQLPGVRRLKAPHTPTPTITRPAGIRAKRSSGSTAFSSIRPNAGSVTSIRPPA